MSEKKEINFFFLEHLFIKGIGYYESFFKEVQRDAIAIGEASPGYICHPKAAGRINRFLPDIKLILSVRNPIDRAFSHYWDKKRMLSERLNFKEAVRNYLETEYDIGKVGYFSRGIYIRYIRNYLAYFDRSQILVLVFEEMVKNPDKTYQRIFEFLGVDTSFKPDQLEKTYNPFMLWENEIYRLFFKNPSFQRYLPKRLKRFVMWGRKQSYIREPIDVQIREELNGFYKPWNDQLAAYLNKDLSFWV